MASPFVFFPGDRLSAAELTAACLDGHLVALGEGYIPADAVETAWMRAASLRPLLGDTLAATRESAAWVHGACAREPARHEVQRAVTRRLHEVRDRRVVYHDVPLRSDDVEIVAGVRVTTVARTLADLARSSVPHHAAVARAWMAEDPAAAELARRWFAAHPRYPGSRKATTLLSATTT